MLTLVTYCTATKQQSEAANNDADRLYIEEQYKTQVNTENYITQSVIQKCWFNKLPQFHKDDSNSTCSYMTTTEVIFTKKWP